MIERDDGAAQLSRREALRLLGAGAAGAGVGLTAACGPGASPEPSNQTTEPAAPVRATPSVVFPGGAIVRIGSALTGPGRADTDPGTGAPAGPTP